MHKNPQNLSGEIKNRIRQVNSQTSEFIEIGKIFTLLWLIVGTDKALTVKIRQNRKTQRTGEDSRFFKINIMRRR